MAEPTRKKSATISQSSYFGSWKSPTPISSTVSPLISYVAVNPHELRITKWVPLAFSGKIFVKNPPHSNVIQRKAITLRFPAWSSGYTSWKIGWITCAVIPFLPSKNPTFARFVMLAKETALAIVGFLFTLFRVKIGCPSAGN